MGARATRRREREPVLAAELERPAVPSKLSLLGHPVHPMLIPFPIAFLCALPFVDVAFAITGARFWADAGFVVVSAGIVTALVAASVGLVDFLLLREVRRNRVAWWHLLSNGLATVVAVANLLVRLPNPAEGALPVGIILSFVTAAAILVGGWYGGELSFRYRIGVSSH